MEFFERHGLEWPDVVLLGVIFILWPLAGEVGKWFYPSEEERNTSETRQSIYNSTMIALWCTALPILIWWVISKRPWADLGFTFTWDLETKIVVGVIALILFLLLIDLIRTAFSASAREKKRNSLSKYKDRELIVPVNGADHRKAMLLSLTAGITEEIIFRGFVIWALSQFMNIWIAGFVSFALFTFLHRYQGLSGMIQVAAITATLTILYLVSGSLWAVIVLHILFDVLAITTLYIATREGREAD